MCRTVALRRHRGWLPVTRPGERGPGSPRLPAGQNLGRQLAWQKERYPEAFYLPMSQFDPSAIPDPRGRQVVFACRSGSRSVTASLMAQAAGFPYDAHLAGGIKAWKAMGLPTQE